MNVDDHPELILVEAVKDDRVVDAIDEFRPEVGLHFVETLLLHVQPVDFGRFSVEEIVLNDVRADVTGHDDNRVSEIDRAPLAIGESAVVEHLQEDVEHVWMRLLNLVEQDHAVRLAADGLLN